MANSFFVAVIPCLLLQGVLVVLPFSEAQGLSSASASCSLSYTLRADASCIRSSQDQYSTCVELSVYLESFNSVLNNSDCLWMILEPGVYQLSEGYTATVLYSIVLSSDDQQSVKFICPIIPQVQATPTTSSSNYSTLQFKGAPDRQTHVSLDGITFEDCERPLQFDELMSVTFTNCSFRGFTASAVDLFNVNIIAMQDCLFENCSTNIGKDRFRGNSGAVSIGYYSSGEEKYSLDISDPVSSITNCTFISNSVILPPDQSATQINQALNDNIYLGRGGGVGIFIQESLLRNITFIIEDCVFDRNIADSFGGGLYLYIAGRDTNHKFIVRNNTFTRNEAGNGSFGGGLQLALLNRNVNSLPSQTDIIGCYFEDNIADFGGGLSTVQVYSQGAGNLVSVNDSTFVNNRARNVGSALSFVSLLYVQNRNESHHYETSNNVYVNNSCPGGTVGIAFINVNFAGTSVFKHNMGPGLRVVGSLVELFPGATLSFIGNNAENHEGGALYLQDFGQIQLYSNSSMEFINNTGRIGSAIVVDVQRSSLVFSQLIFNPQCFLIHENSSLSPQEWTDVSIRFSGNRATVGPVVYISHLDHCSWVSAIRVGNISSQVKATFSILEFPDWPVFVYEADSNTASSHKELPTSSIYYFQTEPVKINSSNGTAPLPIRPGEQGRLNLRGLDQFNNPAYIIVRLSDNRVSINNGAFSQAGSSAVIMANSTDPDVVQFEPSLLPIQPSDDSVTIEYGFQSLTPEQFREDETIKIVLDTPYNVRNADQFTLSISLVACLPGFELRRRTDGEGLVSCRCVREDINVLDCEEDVVILRDGYWGTEELEPTPHLDLTPCPASYCRCHYRGGQTCETLFFQQDPTLNLQCHPLRNGTLCGECINGTGVGVLRTNCRVCDTENYFALGFLVVGDGVLVTLILLLTVKAHMIFPPSLKGFLFYIQTVYYVTEYFPISFWDIRKYMLFISSGLGLYFPWDFCLFPGMTPIVSFAPKFTPAVIATVALVTTIVIVYKTRSRDGREYIWHGVWTLTLLLYAPLVHTSLSLLHCQYTPSAAGEEEAYRWYLDGEVKCFHDPAHTVLGVIAIFVLLVLVLLVPTVFLFTVLGSSKKLQSKSRTVGWLYAALTSGYRDSWETKWWGSYELFRRLLLIGITVALPGRSVANLYVVLTILAIHLFFKPYQKLWQNLLEAVVLIVYSLLLMIRATPTFLDTLAPYSGIEIPENWNGDLTTTDSVTWLLFPFFYLPVLIGVIFIASVIIFKITNRISHAREQYIVRIDDVITIYDDSREPGDARLRSPDYTRTAFGLDEL